MAAHTPCEGGCDLFRVGLDIVCRQTGVVVLDDRLAASGRAAAGGVVPQMPPTPSGSVPARKRRRPPPLPLDYPSMAATLVHRFLFSEEREALQAYIVATSGARAFSAAIAGARRDPRVPIVTVWGKYWARRRAEGSLPWVPVSTADAAASVAEHAGTLVRLYEAILPAAEAYTAASASAPAPRKQRRGGPVPCVTGNDALRFEHVAPALLYVMGSGIAAPQDPAAAAAGNVRPPPLLAPDAVLAGRLPPSRYMAEMTGRPWSGDMNRVNYLLSVSRERLLF